MTALGKAVANACAEIECGSVDEHILAKSGSHLQLTLIGRYAVE